MRLFLIEEAHLTSHLVNTAPDSIQWHPAKRQDGVDFSQVDCAQQSAVQKIGDLLSSRLLENDRQDRGRIEDCGTSQELLPSRGGPLRGARRSIRRRQGLPA